MKPDLKKISKKISYFLRHHPEEIGLKLDKEGWADLNTLCRGVFKNICSYCLDDTCQISDLNLYFCYTIVSPLELVKEVIQKSDKGRFELSEDENKIRALYGHSIETKIVKNVVEPPEKLYHGTIQSALEQIKKEGILPMSRQYVHLTEDIKLAQSTAARKKEKVFILVVDSLKAYHAGVKFYKGNDDIWLSDKIPSSYIHIYAYPKDLEGSI